MHHLWYDEHPEFHGRFADFSGVDAHPRPVQQPIPIVIGGHTTARTVVPSRAARVGTGSRKTPETAAESLTRLRAAASEIERPAALGPLEITVTPRGRLTAETAAAFAELGVDRLVPFPPPTADGVATTIDSSLLAIAGLQ